MPEENNSSAQQAVSDPAAHTSQPRRRRLLRLSIIIVIVVAILGLLFFYAPRYVARHLIAAQLDELGIDYEGVDTLNINLWSRELWLGPVRFGVGPSDRGQLGELGLTLRINPLLEHRVSIERLLVRGIDLVVTRSKDTNELALNGIPLDQFFAPPDAAEQPAEEGDAWDAGIDTFELRDSRLIFQDRERGGLEVDVEQLKLTEFRTWEPKRPGRFELTLRVNDILLKWSGEARPFADNITLDIDSLTEEVDVQKLVRFTGPWGLDRGDGTYLAQLKHEVTLFDTGRVEGHTVGSIDIEGADYELVGVFALALERAKIDPDVHYTLSETGDFALKGQVAMDLGRGSVVADKTRFGITAGRVAMGELDTAYAKNGTLSIAGRPDVDLENVAFSGPIEISVDKLLELLALLQSLSAKVAVSTADTGLGDYVDKSVVVPSSDVKVARLKSKGGAFSLQSSGGQVELDLKTSIDLVDIQIDVNERRINIERLQNVLERLNLKSGQGRLALDMAVSNSLVAGTGVGPTGEIKIAAFESKVDKLGLQTQAGAVSLQLAAASQATGFSSLLYAQQDLPEVQFSIGAANTLLSQASLDAQDSALRWQAAGEAAVDSLSVNFAGGKEGAYKFARAEIKALQVNEQLQLAADAMTVDGLDLYVKRSLLKSLFEDGDASTENTALSGDAAVKPSVTIAAEKGVDVSRVQSLLTELGYAPGSVDGRMGKLTAAAIREFQRREGLGIDGRLTGSLLAALEARAAAPVAGDVAPVVGDAEPVSAGVRVEHLALTGKSVIRFRDDIVTPQVNIDTVFKEAQIRNLDTQKADQRTEVRLIADVNEFTHVDLAGWIKGVGKSVDFDLKAEVENLELSTYSPYVTELAGVHLESGQLDTTITGKAVQGGLQGKIQLELDDIAIRPLSKADAARVTGAVGVPLETAVGLLQDSNGRILLTLPVSGTLSGPDVDISSAVNKAIGGALKKVFPPTMIASMLSGVAKGSGHS